MWSEIRCNYCDEETGFWCVDAWTGDDDAEEGKVIAFIDDLTARVIYVDSLARTDQYAQRIINEKLHDLESNRVRVRRETGEINVYFETAAGTLVAQVENHENVGTDNMYIGIHFPDHHYDYIDLVGVKVLTENLDDLIGANKYALVPMIWGDPASEDYTDVACITDSDINEALAEDMK